VGEIRRIDEMSRRVRFFSSQIAKEKDVVPIRPLYESAPLITVGPRAAQTIDELDTTLAEYELRLATMNESYQTLSERTKELIEAKHVLRETAVFFNQVRGFFFFSVVACWLVGLRVHFRHTITRRTFVPRSMIVQPHFFRTIMKEVIHLLVLLIST